jgi:elongation factor G
MAFKIAAIQCFKEAEIKSAPKVLEPIMSVEVTIPEEFMGDVLGYLKSKRGEVEGMREGRGSGMKIVTASVPLSEMFGYATELRSRTQGRGTYTMQFSNFRELPEQIKTRMFA